MQQIALWPTQNASSSSSSNSRLPSNSGEFKNTLDSASEQAQQGVSRASKGDDASLAKQDSIGEPEKYSASNPIHSEGDSESAAHSAASETETNGRTLPLFEEPGAAQHGSSAQTPSKAQQNSRGVGIGELASGQSPELFNELALNPNFSALDTSALQAGSSPQSLMSNGLPGLSATLNSSSELDAVSPLQGNTLQAAFSGSMVDDSLAALEHGEGALNSSKARPNGAMQQGAAELEALIAQAKSLSEGAVGGTAIGQGLKDQASNLAQAVSAFSGSGTDATNANTGLSTAQAAAAVPLVSTEYSAASAVPMQPAQVGLVGSGLARASSGVSQGSSGLIEPASGRSGTSLASGMSTAALQNPNVLPENQILDQTFSDRMMKAALDGAPKSSSIVEPSSLNDTLVEFASKVELSVAKPADASAKEINGAARPYVSTLGLPVSDAEWANQLGQKLAFLHSRNISTTELHLNPAEFGPIDVRISMNGDQATINFNSQNASVRELLESNMHRLREMFTEQTNAPDADAGPSSQNSEQSAERFSDSQSNQGRVGFGRDAQGSEEPVVDQASVQSQSDHLVDDYI